MAKYTPGPWMIGRGERIQTVPNETGDTEQIVAEHAIGRPANRRLIIAAPDLLAACKLANRIILAWVNHEDVEMHLFAETQLEIENVCDFAEGKINTL